MVKYQSIYKDSRETFSIHFIGCLHRLLRRFYEQSALSRKNVWIERVLVYMIAFLRILQSCLRGFSETGRGNEASLVTFI